MINSRFSNALRTSLFGMILLYSSPMFADVNVRNGNFSLSYHDVTSKTSDVVFAKTYNSKSTYDGWTGSKWMIRQFEARLNLESRDEITVKGINYTNDLKFDRNELKNPNSHPTVEINGPNCPSTSPGSSSELSYKLVAGYKGKLITYYSLLDCDGSVYKFNNKGLLSSLNSTNLNSTINYDYPEKSTRPESLTVYQSTTSEKLDKFKLIWLPNGKLSKILNKEASVSKPTAEYFYNKKGNLIKVDDETGNTYKFEYTENHFLNKIIYVDNTVQVMDYDKNGLITKVLTREDTLFGYQYLEPDSENEYGTIKTSSNKSKKTPPSVEEFYWNGDDVLVKHVKNSLVVYEAKYEDKNAPSNRTYMLSSATEFNPIYIEYDRKGNITNLINGKTKDTFFTKYQGNAPVFIEFTDGVTGRSTKLVENGMTPNVGSNHNLMKENVLLLAKYKNLIESIYSPSVNFVIDRE